MNGLFEGDTLRDLHGNSLVVNGARPEVFIENTYGPYASAEKRGQPCCHRRRISELVDMTTGGHWTNQDQSGKTYRIYFDGVKSEYLATEVAPRVFEFRGGVALVPRGDILG